MDKLEKNQKACQTCVHFMASVKENPGRGLCTLYSAVMRREDVCRHGYQPRLNVAPPTRVPA